MTWSTFHRRGDVLRAVVAAAETRRDGVLPWGVDGVDAVFEDERDLLGALQLRWHTRLAGCIDRRQMSQPRSLEDAVVSAWQDAQAELGGVRRVLDAARDSDSERVRDAMTRATAKERQTLAYAAGLGAVPGATSDAASARVGALIERRARETSGAERTASADAATVVVASGVWDRMLERLRSFAA